MNEDNGERDSMHLDLYGILVSVIFGYVILSSGHKDAKERKREERERERGTYAPPHVVVECGASPAPVGAKLGKCSVAQLSAVRYRHALYSSCTHCTTH